LNSGKEEPHGFILGLLIKRRYGYFRIVFCKSLPIVLGCPGKVKGLRGKEDEPFGRRRNRKVYMGLQRE
jgi:hypothetical protein